MASVILTSSIRMMGMIAPGTALVTLLTLVPASGTGAGAVRSGVSGGSGAGTGAFVAGAFVVIAVGALVASATGALVWATAARVAAASPTMVMRLGLGFICIVKFRHWANNDKALFFIPVFF